METIPFEKLTELLRLDACTLVDVRQAEAFAAGHVKGALFLPSEALSQAWLAEFIRTDRPMVLLGGEEAVENLTAALQRLGHRAEMPGFRCEGNGSLPEDFVSDMVILVEPDELAMDLPYDERLLMLDVRGEPEYASGHVIGAVNIPLQGMHDPGSMAMIEDSDTLYVYAATMERAMMAASLLKIQGFDNLRVVAGGWPEILKEERLPREKDPGKLN